MSNRIAPTTLLLAAAVALAAPRVSATVAEADESLGVLPMPSSIVMGTDTFRFDASTVVETNAIDARTELIRATIATLSADDSGTIAPQDGSFRAARRPVVRLTCTEGSDIAARAPYEVHLQGYTLTVAPDTITISSPTTVGLLYGAQTLLQMVHGGRVACCEITDAPRYGHRGLMLDCSRHFFSPRFICRLIDAMARYKLNRLHLHLTDAGGWRFPSDSYPLLTELTAYRTASDWRTWWEGGDRRYCLRDDDGAYGGAYTKDELRRIVAYADARGIVVVPEIEMPGHSEEVLYAYPELRCDCPEHGGDLCIGNADTFVFIESVLDEVMDVFPSPVIHIGGDEAGGNTWRRCSRCRRRMEQEGLADNAALQGYLTARVERYLLSRGRRLAGWDEILAGTPSQQAVVVCWRGKHIGEEAARRGHDVVMAPLGYYYLDYYQDAPPTQPRAMGIYTPLEATHAFDPAIGQEDLDERVIGVQGNLWTEYVDDERCAERMLWPRALAVAETGWSAHKEPYDGFRRRALAAVDALTADGYAPFRLADEAGQRPEAALVAQSLASVGSVVYVTPYSEKYPAAGAESLIDGRHGGWAHGDGAWQGFADGRFSVVVDMGEEREIHHVAADFMQSAAAWIYAPETFEIALAGDDGATAATCDRRDELATAPFTVVESATHAADDGDYFIRRHEWHGVATARYVRLTARIGRDGAWLFTDEVVVE